MKYKTLILCTGNSCRSVMLESLLNYYLSDKFIAYSAGSNPTGKIHPLTLDTLTNNNIPTNNLYSKSWDQFTNYDLDLVITVCDNAKNETCPVFLGKIPKIHLGFEDPAKVTGSEDFIKQEFQRIFDAIKLKVLEIKDKNIKSIEDLLNN